VVFAVVFGSLLLCAAGVSGQTRTPLEPAASDLSSSLEATTRLVGPAVVEIFTTSYAPGEGLVPRTADLISTQRASGSGVILDAAGYIVTNAHVVRGAQHLRVEVPLPTIGQSILAARSRTVIGQVVGIDLETDLAVIKIEERNLPALAFGGLRRAQGGPGRAGVRESPRPQQLGLTGRGQRGRAAARARIANGVRPNGRAHQSRQQRRAAGRHARPADWDQYADPVVLQLERRGELMYLAFTVE